MSAQTGSYKIAFDAGDGAGVIKSVLNPEAADLYITRAVLNITTKSTGACTLDIGVDAAAATSDDTLFDGFSGATAVVTDNIKEVTGNSKAGVKWPSGQYLNIAEASGDVTGIVAELHLEWVRL